MRATREPTVEMPMPLETTLALAAIAIVFGGYALLLGWGVWYTTRKA